MLYLHFSSKNNDPPPRGRTDANTYALQARMCHPPPAPNPSFYTSFPIEEANITCI